MFTSFTAGWHDDTYDFIDPSKRPELSVSGKTVVISGGGRGIGQGIAVAFALAGADTIVLLGRAQSSLDATKQEIQAKHSQTKVLTHSVDVVDHEAVTRVAKAVGRWDIFISNAGYAPAKGYIVDAQPEEWWKGFEINVKGTFNVLHALLPLRNEKSIVIGVSAASIQIPGDFAAGISGYNASKVAALKVFETAAVEYPDVHIVSLHPGVVQTDMMKSSDMTPPQIDTIELPSHTAVWLCSDEAKFLRGKFVWANWDAQELKSRSHEVEGNLTLTLNILGFPFQYPVGQQTS